MTLDPAGRKISNLKIMSTQAVRSMAKAMELLLGRKKNEIPTAVTAEGKTEMHK